VYAISLLLAVVLYIGVVTLALVRRGVSGAFLGITGTAIFGLWLTFFVMSAAGYKYAGGWLECQGSCSNLQTAAGSIFIYGLAALALLLVVFGIDTIARPPTRSR